MGHGTIPGSVLPTVMVVSVLMALSVLAVVSLWESDFLYFSRRMHDRAVRAHIESGFTLYAAHPDETIAALDADSTLLLYDSVPRSRVAIRRRPHGLFELVTVSSHDGKVSVSKLFGLHPPADNFLLYTPDRGSALTLTGKTRLEGPILIPAIGVMYGQMEADFFTGDQLVQSRVGVSADSLPGSTSAARDVIAGLLARVEDDAEELIVDSLWHSPDTVVVARKVRVTSGFAGSLQIFALDSVVVESGVTLEYPSGLFSQTNVTVGDNSTVNGYIVVAPASDDDADEPDIMQANYRQSRGATVRGLVHIAGNAQLQGIVSGTAMVNRAMFYSPRGYYENMLYDVTLLENRDMAWPLWLATTDSAATATPRRKEAKWLH
jgi:hypothetical protein